MIFDYTDFKNQRVRVITTGRVTQRDFFNVGDSLQLEGILEKETGTLIFLKDMHTTQESNGQLVISSPYGAVSKDKIISVYRISEKEASH